MNSRRRPTTNARKENTLLTLEEFATYICPAWDKPELLTWPPDVFAVTASLLLKSGAYSRAVSGWTRSKSLEVWVPWITEVAKRWRTRLESPPKEIRTWHKVLLKKETRKCPVLQISEHKPIYDALLHLSATADEACVGVGFGMLSADRFLRMTSARLFLSGETLGASTLCDRIDHAAVRVMPKRHTPQIGITMRSLTNHLTLCPAGDVSAKWAENPCANRHYFNILLAPWPLVTTPSDFHPVDPSKSELRQMPKKFGFFEYNPLSHSKSDDPVRKLNTLIKEAQGIVSKIDGVILPEGALTDEQHGRLKTSLMKKDIFIICGVRSPASSEGKAGINCLRINVPVDLPFGKFVGSHEQSKHHRWSLDKAQIVRYGLGSCLDVQSKWWEHISIGNRVLYFVVLDDWLTICPLICEDLARQDPVSDIVRAVGPNLVIAILMDGPQLESRWPARYATVLTEDPGSSVLTLTSLGMSTLSRPPGKPISRAVALWKDARSGEAISIELPEGADGLILSLSRERETEWSADGRHDGGATGYPVLSGVHPVSIPRPEVVN